MVDIRGKRVTVMGLGTFGGGIGAVRFLVGRGAHVTVTDLRSESDLAGALAELADAPPAAWHLARHETRDFIETDLLVVSPAIPKTSPYLRLARDAHVPITSEMNLFWSSCRGRILGITGTNGKSTTTALTHAILSRAPVAGGGANTCWLGGNIGGSLLPEVDAILPDDWVVLELSSFQLEDLAPLEPACDIAVVTNFAPNHLDRHETLDAYRHAKQNLLRWQASRQVAVLNQDDADVSRWPYHGQALWFGGEDRGREGVFGFGRTQAVLRLAGREEVFPLRDWLSLPGEHNFLNALAAVCAATAAGASLDQIELGVRNFRALPHRLQLVAAAGRRTFYNDSKATTPEAAMLALASFSTPVVLIAGGYDKEVDLAEFARRIVSRGVRAASLIGQTAGKLETLIQEFDPGRCVRTRVHGNFKEAFEWAVEQSEPDDTVLLSPGCASYDWFRNFEERGAEFTRLVRAQNS